MRLIAGPAPLLFLSRSAPIHSGRAQKQVTACTHLSPGRRGYAVGAWGKSVKGDRCLSEGQSAAHGQITERKSIVAWITFLLLKRASCALSIVAQAPLRAVGATAVSPALQRGVEGSKESPSHGALLVLKGHGFSHAATMAESRRALPKQSPCGISQNTSRNSSPKPRSTAASAPISQLWNGSLPRSAMAQNASQVLCRPFRSCRYQDVSLAHSF